MASTIVYSFSELRTALTDNSIDLIHLGADIVYQSANGIRVEKGSGAKIIDGTDPFDPSIIHSITDNNSGTSTYTIYVPSVSYAAGFSITFRNLVFIGRNYYGICHVTDSQTNANTTLVLENVEYSGPQAVHNRSGITRIVGGNYRIGDYNGTICSVDEFSETSRLIFEGSTVIDHRDSTDALFWMTESDASFSVLANARLDINTTSYVFYCAGGRIDTSFAPFSSTSIHTKDGMYLSGSSVHMASSFAVGEGASVYIEADTLSNPAIKFYSALSVDEGASLIVMNKSSVSTQLVYGYSAAALRFTNPKTVAFFSIGSPVLRLANNSTINIESELAFIWSSATTFQNAGTFDDIATRSFSRANGQDIVISASISSLSLSNLTTNIVEGDEGFPMTASTFNILSARELSFGRLPLFVEEISELSSTIEGQSAPSALIRVSERGITHELSADELGVFRYELGEVDEGESVAVGANTPFLIRTVQKVVKGDLKISFLPERLPFKTIVVPFRSEFVPRKQTDWRIEVTDNRDQGGAWELYATITGQMSSQTSVLPDSLGLRELGAFAPFSGEKTLIHRGYFTQKGAVTTISWQKLEGILLRINPIEMYERGYYNTTIIWSIEH